MVSENKFNNLNEVLDETSERYADKIFLTRERISISKLSKEKSDSNSELYKDSQTYSEFHDNVLRFANVLRSFGTEKGDFVGLQLNNSIEFCITLYACYRIGAVATPVSSLWKLREMCEVIEKAQIKTIILDSKKIPMIKKCGKTQPIQNIILIGEDFNDFSAVKGEFWDLITKALNIDAKIKINPDRIASCHFTRGTTGDSKAVLHNHKGHIYSYQVVSNTFEINEQSHLVLVLPMSHIFGFTILGTIILKGGSCKLLNRFDPQFLLKSLEDPNMTFFCGVPSIFNMLVAQDNLEDFNISSKNKYFISGAGALPKKTEEEINKRLLKGKGRVCQAYGSTEDLCCGTGTYERGLIGSIGKPMIGSKLEIINESGEILPFGEENVGMLISQGPYIMMGYLGNPKDKDPVDNKQTFEVLKAIKDKTGIWYRTGDIGYRDKEGNFYLVDRAKDIAKVSERLVYPSEVEKTLVQHLYIKEITVLGVPHYIYGEQLLAVIVLHESAKNKIELEKRIQEYAEENLAKYKIPRVWWFRSMLKKNNQGKVIKRWYKEEYINFERKEKLKNWLFFDEGVA